MTEQALQTKIMNLIKKKGFWATKVISSSKTGTPDILACIHGRFVAIEVKAPGKINNVTDLQRAQLNAIIESGGRAAVVDSIEDLDTLRIFEYL